ncbi:MAG TPA: geranylgeranyl reductase family protein [Vicinamibacterales bacterium]|jgi:geranylgeranyl reductase family protein
MRFDSLVVGAGPAGCIAARDLARAGARVAIIDASHPREKACGGGVTGRALSAIGCERFHVLADAQSVRQALFEVERHYAPVPIDSEDVLNVFPRAALDAQLLADAVASGAVHLPARVLSFERVAADWNVATSRGPVAGSWLLGADGASGIVRKQVFRPFARTQLSIAAGSFVDEATTTEIVIRFVDRPRGYLWSFPRPDHLAVGACARADDTTTAELQAICDRWLEGYAPASGRRRRRYAWPIPSLSAADFDHERPAGDGWMLLGDAAGLVDPITREGIFFALRSGSLAAAALAGEAPARDYATALRNEIYPELKRAARLHDTLFRPRFTRLLLEGLTRSAPIRRVMIDLIGGRQPYAGLKRRLIATGELRLMVKLLLSSPF